MHRPRRIAPPAAGVAIEQAGHSVERLPVLHRAQQLAKRQFAFAADDAIHTRFFRHVRLRRQAGIVTAHHDLPRRRKLAHQLNDLKSCPALEGHHREPQDLRVPFGDELLHRGTHVVLRQNQVGDRDTMMRIDIPGQRSECAIRHAHRHNGHVLERIGHGQ